MKNDDQSNQQDKKSQLRMAMENNPCSLCRAMSMPPPCKGHASLGGGGGGGGSEVGSSSSGGGGKANDAVEPYKYISEDSTGAGLESENLSWKQLLSNDKSNSYDIGLIHIEGDRINGKMSFKLKPGLSNEETKDAKEYLKAVKSEFEIFKNELNEKGVPVNNFHAELKDDELSIHIPNPKYYDAFIKHLENKNLLPSRTLSQINVNASEALNKPNQNESKKATPFDDIYKGPRPKGWDDV